METLLIILVIIILIWVVYGYFSSQVKEPKFSVLEKKDGYEIREYVPYIEARVKVSGNYREAMSSGFQILAGYIFGGNTRQQAIAMTTPVSEATLGDNIRVVAFVMPEKYTLSTLPKPNDNRIEIVEVKSHKSAVLRYSGYNNEKKVATMKTKLQESLKRDRVVAIGLPRGAGYNPPWTPPFMRRNEIFLDVN